MTVIRWLKWLLGGDMADTQPVKSSDAKQIGLVGAIIQVVRELDAADIRETEGKNQGPGIRRFWGATSYGYAGYAAREPWCAAATCWIIAEAVFRVLGLEPYKFTLPRSASVVGWRGWANANRKHWQLLDPEKTTVKAGDIVGWDFNGPIKGGTHIGVAVVDERPDRTFDSGEGNTDATGTREGDEFLIHKNRTRKAAIYIIRYIG